MGSQQYQRVTTFYILKITKLLFLKRFFRFYEKAEFLFFPTILALTFGLMLSCAKKSIDDSKTTTDDTITLSSSLANIDVVDAESLFIVPGSSSSSTNTLFKINVHPANSGPTIKQP